MKKTVLIIDDNYYCIELLNEQLFSTGIKVISARTGKQGMEFFINKNIDIVLLDVGLPDVNGLTLLKMMSKIKKVPIVIISAYAFNTDIHEGIKAGAIEYLTKPLKIEKLFGVFSKHLDLN